ncbi:putative metal-dependent protease of the PAD1/JAB1 superfamily [Saprospira grandis DSM 2844]|uniref:Putative metal-dependent protease of the PAD1/JAB1 superfamily n=1 Tax=Saprospira grandis DSM 2844 TaxID=694433 RepID=J0P0E9_9BACT|nr:M67 family metallopeptidase [Saprospira grandis]EJF53249.1 putative metal-dependent protease of the PAD1/JAB1 superfamily [Saprospira grandis DSM 2844]
MSYQLSLAPEAEQYILQQLEADFPNEGCGFFYGTEENEGQLRHVLLAEAVINSKEGDQRRRFEISPLDYMKAERKALELGLNLLGIYHSHPNHPAIPSIHDLKQAVPYFSYIILSVQEGRAAELTSWRLNEERREFEAEEVKRNNLEALAKRELI